MKSIFASIVTCLVLSSALSPKEREAVEEFGRKLREEVQPPASDIKLLTYSMEMEQLAEKYKNGCLHGSPDPMLNPEYQDTQMLFWFDSGQPLPFPDYLKDVLEQKQEYDFDKRRCRSTCVHYLQFVYANATEVGCATHVCGIDDASAANSYHVALCVLRKKYERGRRPYHRGPSCSRCPLGYECFRRQCKQIDSADAIKTTRASQLSLA
uniref:SCP domain-containing protein n=1 Tax=Mesocestoides corti TaxID=53468 RepID=A0A5K3EFN8_MESCO